MSDLPPPALEPDADLLWLRNTLLDADIELRRARRHDLRTRHARLDARIFRCPGCDALVLPKRLMRTRHECVRTRRRAA